jgi:hypothetical protein
VRKLARVAKDLTKTGLEAVSSLRPQHWDALRLSLQPASPENRQPLERHLRAAIEWIKAAQDTPGTGGVSWGYRARARIRTSQKVGWLPPYPETSGYILETLLRFGQAFSDPDAIARAQRIADWEVGIQLPDGGIQGGMIGAQPVESSTFVTGQVLFGFIAAWRKFGDPRYRDAAHRAARFLVGCLDETGRFVRGYSHFCAAGPKAYEVRTGWALAMAGCAFDEPAYVDAGRRTAAFALECQRENGWFATNDLDDHDRPLTHTIGYTLEGLYEIGVLAGDARLFDAVERTLSRLKMLATPEGFLAGRWTAAWEPAARWCCLTGSSQVALVAFRMEQRTGTSWFAEFGSRLLRFVAATQPLSGSNPGIAGGIHGSYPFDGEYGQYCNLNWAAKFYADAIMDSLGLPR